MMGSSKKQGELWGKAPLGWVEIQEPMHAPLWEAMINAAEVESGTRFLDAGCGGGGASAMAAERGARVTGLDAAAGLLEYARETVSDGVFQVGDIQDLPFEDQAFDVVFASNSIQYAEDRIAALKEFSRVCDTDGRIVAGLFGPPEKVEFRAVLKAVRDAMPEPPPGGGPFELSGPGKLEDLFSEAGLEVLKTGEVDCPFYYPDFDTFWFGNVAAGPFQGVLQTVHEEELKSAVHDAVEAFTLENGEILIQPNLFTYVLASV